jgi:glycosyltransferase involved in cell wall biosynthesis
MDILMLVSNPVSYDPRVLAEAQSLATSGHRVTVVGWDRRGEFQSHESRDGIEIVRIRHTRTMRLLPFDLLRLRSWWRVSYNVARQLQDEAPFDVVHCHDLDTLPTGVRLKGNHRLRLVYDAHELWPNMVAQDLPKVLVNRFTRLERRMLPQVDGLILAEESYNPYFQKLGGGPPPVTVLNAKTPVSDEYVPPTNDVPIFLYVGTLARARFLPGLLSTLGEIDGVRLRIGGMGKLFSKVAAQARAFENVEFLGRLPAERVLPLTLESDVVCCLVDPEVVNNRIASTNKQFEAMACGRPILCTEGTRSGEITAEEECGLVIPYTKDALREAVLRLRDSPQLRERLGRAAFEAALHKYNWANEERKLLGLYDALEGMA